MSYIVPMKMPKYCDKCPFGMCNYSYPLCGNSVSKIDGKENETYTKGYVCNVDWWLNGKYTKIIRANTEEHIPRPEWCRLKEVRK